MGAYKYIQELWRKKKYYIMSFVFRLHHWWSCYLSELHRASSPYSIHQTAQ